MNDRIGPQQFHEAEGTGDWRVVGDGACAFFRTASFAVAARFAGAIGEMPDVDDRYPDLDLRRDGVTVRLRLRANDYFGLSGRDVEMARQISAAASELGLDADPTAVQSLLVVPGAPAIGKVMPFWQALLGYQSRPGNPDGLIDPRERAPSFWFEQMEQPRPDGGGAIHIAVFVPVDQAEARVAAALAAGGTMVRDEFAPSWWTLADAAGNEADIATTRGRGEAPAPS